MNLFGLDCKELNQEMFTRFQFPDLSKIIKLKTRVVHKATYNLLSHLNIRTDDLRLGLIKYQEELNRTWNR